MSDDTLIGRTIGGRFRIVERLGEGAMAEVYRARHEVLDRDYAIKVLRIDFEGDRAVVERFRREALAASRLSHPCIIDISDFGHTEDGRFYLVMEFLEGRDLQAELEELLALSAGAGADAGAGLMPLERVLGLLEQVANALGAAHDAGVIHRDLKPANILLTKDARGEELVKILDFGLAKIVVETELATLTEKGEIFGTPAYISPEQVIGEAVDSRCDIYAFGVMAFEMCTGRLPFTAEAVALMLLAHRDLTPPAPSSIRPAVSEMLPIELDRIILKCLEKDRERRPLRMTEVERVLRSCEETLQKEHLLISEDVLSPVPPNDEEVLRLWVNAPTHLVWDEAPMLRAGGERTPLVDDLRRRHSRERLAQIFKVTRALARQMRRVGLSVPAFDQDLLELQQIEEIVLESHTELALLQSHLDDLLARTREQDAQLRHAIIDLSLERSLMLEQSRLAAANVADLDYQIGQLETRLAEVYRGQSAGKQRLESEIQAERSKVAQDEGRLEALEFNFLESVLQARPPNEQARLLQAYEKLVALVRDG